MSARFFGVSAAIFLCVAAVMHLTGCEAKLNVKSAPSTPLNQQVEVRVPNNLGLAEVVSISEMCYDGVVYLINSRGGMAPKINPDRGGQFSLFVSCQ